MRQANNTSSISEFEVFYGIVLFGRVKTLSDIKNYIRNFSDAHIVFDKTSPLKLFVTEKDPRKEGEK